MSFGETEESDSNYESNFIFMLLNLRATAFFHSDPDWIKKELNAFMCVSMDTKMDERYEGEDEEKEEDSEDDSVICLN